MVFSDKNGENTWAIYQLDKHLKSGTFLHDGSTIFVLEEGFQAQ